MAENREIETRSDIDGPNDLFGGKVHKVEWVESDTPTGPITRKGTTFAALVSAETHIAIEALAQLGPPDAAKTIDENNEAALRALWVGMFGPSFKELTAISQILGRAQTQQDHQMREEVQSAYQRLLKLMNKMRGKRT